jgi:cell division protein FtsZ
VVTGAADQNANVIFGAVIDDSATDEVRVTVIATGFGAQRRRRVRSTFETAAPVAGQRAPEFEPGPGDLDVPSFLRGE